MTLLRCCLLTIALATSLLPATADAEPFVMVGGATLAGHRLPPNLRLPDGSELLLLELMSSLPAVGDAPLVVLDLADRTLYADLPGWPRRAAPFGDDGDGVLIAMSGSGGRFVPLGSADLLALLATPGAVAYRPYCPRAAFCPAVFELPLGIFADDFETSNLGRWSAWQG
jgi:hypothetical protein